MVPGSLEASSMALLDGHCQIFVRVDFGRKLVSQYFDYIKAGQQAVRIAQRQTFLGEEEVGNEHHSAIW